MAIKIHHPTTREEWLGLRKTNIGASEVAALFGEHAFISPFALAARKSGMAEDDEETPAMRRGRYLESVGIELLREERPAWEIVPNALPDMSYFVDTKHNLAATPDAFAVDPGRDGKGVIQVKSVQTQVFKKKWQPTGSMEPPEPPMYACIQASIEAAIAGASWACVVALVVDYGIDLHIIDVPVLPELYAKAKQLSRLFWEKLGAGEVFQPDYAKDASLIKALYPDAIEGKTVDLSKDNHIVGLASADWGLAFEQKKIETARKAIKAEVLAKMGDAEIALVNGAVYCTAKKVEIPPKAVRGYSFRKVHFKGDRCAD